MLRPAAPVPFLHSNADGLNPSETILMYFVQDEIDAENTLGLSQVACQISKVEISDKAKKEAAKLALLVDYPELLATIYTHGKIKEAPSFSTLSLAREKNCKRALRVLYDNGFISLSDDEEAKTAAAVSSFARKAIKKPTGKRITS